MYPGTQTLRNLYEIRDPAQLALVEARLTSLRGILLWDDPEPGAYDLAHLRAFHRRLFQDVYEWAGQLRTVDIAKGDMFAHHPHIESYLGGVLAQLPRENFLRDAARDELVDRLTYYLAEINAVHPFREGNGRTQRTFLGQLAAEAGHFIDWADLDPAENIAASRAAMNGDNAPLRRLIDSRTLPFEARARAMPKKHGT